MKRSFTLSLCAIALTAFTMSDARADNLQVDLEYSGGTWSLYAEVIDTNSGADGSFGISAVRALVDNIDFGTNGSAVSIESGNGAINPVPTSGGDRAPVLQLAGGTLDVLYGQDISDGPSVVTGVGVGSRAKLASGTYSGGAPTAGQDGSLLTDGLFLNTGSGPFGNAVDPDNVLFSLTDIGGGFLLNDANDDGSVDNLDIPAFVQALTDLPGYQASFPGVVVPGQIDSNQDSLFNNNDIPDFVAALVGGSSAGLTSVPEPSALLIASVAVCIGFVSRKRVA